ncbi:MAG: hypothetical protein FH756_07525 [Firmicutes bacterium]|nr:hypothetical protein [Bacillota bacterium]
MEYEVRAEVDEKLSIDPSYIIRYQVFKGGNFIGDGVVQFHREAAENSIPLTGLTDAGELNTAEKDFLRHQIASAAISHMQEKGFGILGNSNLNI